MKRIPIACLLLFTNIIVKAQTTIPSDSSKQTIRIDSTMKVEIESEFPGGTIGWNRFLARTLVYPDKAIRKNIQGEVIARFIVEKDGTLSDIAIVSGPKELRPAVLDVLKQSPNWHPAVQNGKKVKS